MTGGEDTSQAKKSVTFQGRDRPGTHLYGMPYKDPEHKRQWEQRHRGERSQRRRAQRAALSPTISSKVVPPLGPTPEEEEHSGWGVFLLLAGIVLSLPILFFGFGSGQTQA